MDRPKTPNVHWNWQWKDNGRRFHVDHFITDTGRRSEGHGGRALFKIVKYAYTEHDAEMFSIQMGGGAPSARWLDEQFGYHLEVQDVEGYSGDAWRDPDADREDGREDQEGDNHSSVYAVTPDFEYMAWEYGWAEEAE